MNTIRSTRLREVDVKKIREALTSDSNLPRHLLVYLWGTRGGSWNDCQKSIQIRPVSDSMICTGRVGEEARNGENVNAINEAWDGTAQERAEEQRAPRLPVDSHGRLSLSLSLVAHKSFWRTKPTDRLGCRRDAGRSRIWQTIVSREDD